MTTPAEAEIRKALERCQLILAAAQIASLESELSSLKAAGTRADGIEAAAKVHEPSCSCPHPCDDYFIWPSPCHKKAAAVIRALSPAPEAKPVVGEIVAWLRTVDWDSESRSYAKAFADEIASRFGKEGR